MRTQPHRNLNNHVIICGLGHVGYRIAELLHALCVPFVIVTRDIRPAWRETTQARAARYIEGDARSERCLREAGIETARAILIVTDDDLINIETALDAQRLNPKLAIIVRVFDRYLADRIGRETSVRNVLSPALLTAPVFVAAALGEEIARAFAIGGCHLNVARLAFTATTPGLGEPIGAFCAQHNLIPLALVRSRGTPTASAAPAPWRVCPAAGPQEEAAIPPETALRAGDALIAAASGPATERLRLAGYLPPRDTAHAGKSRLGAQLLALLHRPLFPASTLQRVWRRTPRVLRAAFLALLSLMMVSVFVFHAALPGSPRWIDCFYFVITMMTTVGFGDYNLSNAPDWLKLYGCGVMIAAVTLAAIVFGIITDYIVAVRVEQALGHRTTSLTNHIVVIGLGDVGTRVAEELHRSGEPVVAIERHPDHESVPALQDQMHVIIGDANRDSILQQANVARSRAVIVTTTNDLDSLRIAHQAEMINPKLRSVIRIYDSELADKLGVGLGIDRAVNAAATAAATFVACALQPGVEQGFTLGKRLLALRWLAPEEITERGLAGATIGALRAQGIMVALRRTESRKGVQAMPVSETETIAPDDHLLLLEEYYPTTHRFGPPQIAVYTDGDPR
ncbi:MAG TPA: NAD-binding protein [Chthonomonadaceae bacterium]|nr:NAD-binding protein [Chthonomonadaceae bacterium]